MRTMVTTPLYTRKRESAVGTALPLSLLDFSPMRDGETASDSLRRTVELARQTESLDYRRFWFTEHHNVPCLTNAAPAVVLAHIASMTRSIRVGSGGVMLPNHSPLVIAEQFGTLAGLHPGRIDLGIGRATGGPGADSEILRMLRKPPDARDRFESDLDELLALLDERLADDAPYVPARGLDVPVWLLGSSTSSAALAGKLGLPFSYATHIAPDDLQVALHAYRTNFRVSRTLQRDYAMISAFIIAASPASGRARGVGSDPGGGRGCPASPFRAQLGTGRRTTPARQANTGTYGSTSGLLLKPSGSASSIPFPRRRPIPSANRKTSMSNMCLIARSSLEVEALR
jgi:luciferase family oxidoreductase group 1